MTKIGLIREGKMPPDHRVALSPFQCKELMNKYPELEIIVQPSPHRCFTEDEYRKEGIAIAEDLSHCDILLGIKEVPIEQLIPEKQYLFFSHTIKKQPYNRAMLRAIVEKGITLTDYECLTWENGNRILGFGRFAGIVGAHNGLLTWGKKNQLFELKPAHQCKNYLELKLQYSSVKLPPIKMAVTGDGRVAHGTLELLRFLKIKEVTPQQYLEEQWEEPVFVHLRSENYYRRKDGREWDKSDFYHNPQDYESSFLPYTRVTDLMFNAIFWKQGIPIFFSKEQMKSPDFRIKVIADISCDVDGSIPCTVKATSIEDPVFGWHTHSEKVVAPFLSHTVDVMAVSNLPCELPADASVEFGDAMLRYVIPHLLNEEQDAIIDRATITKKGYLTQRFQYLEDYIA